MRNVLLSIFFALIAHVSFSQAIISTLSISPTNPSDCENVTATISLILYCANYTYNGATVSTSGNNVTINLNYTAGQICLPALVYPTVTVNLGQLNSGSVSITAVAYLNSSVSSTSSPVNTTVSSCCGAGAAFTMSNDTICQGETVSMNNQTANADSIKWFQDSVFVDTTWSPTMTFNTSGYIPVELVAYSDTCNDSVTKYVQVHPTPQVDLGPDTTICEGGVLNVTAPNGQSHLWSDGATTQSNTLDTLETKWVEVTSGQGCLGYDTVSVIGILPYSTVDLGPDQTICPEDTITLTPGSGFANYLWYDGSTGATLDASLIGMYWVEANNANECASRDSILISHHIVSPIQFIEDSNKCGSNTISTSIGYGTYQWSTGDITSSTTVYDTTFVNLTAIDLNGCEVSGSILAEVLAVPAVNLGNDTHVCPGDPLILSSNVSGIYLWSTGGAGSTLLVTSAGQYWLHVTGENGCTGGDTIDVGVCVGLNDINSSLTIFPTPASDYLNLELLDAQPRAIEIITAEGRLVKSIGTSSSVTRIYVGDIESGTYFLRLSDESKSEARPILIRH